MFIRYPQKLSAFEEAQALYRKHKTINVSGGIYLQQQPADSKGSLWGLLGSRGAAWLPAMARPDLEETPTWG